MCLFGMIEGCDEGTESKDMAPRADAGRWGGAGRVSAMVAISMIKLRFVIVVVLLRVVVDQSWSARAQRADRNVIANTTASAVVAIVRLEIRIGAASRRDLKVLAVLVHVDITKRA